METELTIELDEHLLREIEAIAAEEGTPLPVFIARQIEEMVRNWRNRLEGSASKPSWRDELHGR